MPSLRVVAPTLLPRELEPTTGLRVDLPSGSVVIPMALPSFRRWPTDRPKPADTKGNKPLVEVAGHPSFGELAILSVLVRDGWDGRWIDNYPLPPTFRRAYWDASFAKLSREQANVSLPVAPRAAYESICGRANDSRGGGAWDVIAWRDDEMVFIEAKKRASGDKIRPGQLRWLDAALQLGVPRECFLFVEWTAS
jgi:hypothetical protein